MTEQECLALMVPPGAIKPQKYGQGVVQVHVTRACDKACYNCTQNSQLAGKAHMIPVEMFEQAIISLKDYHGVVGVFGGNPAVHPHFEALCEVLRKHIPLIRRGLWCNNPINRDKGQAMRETFNPAVSNLNVHLDQKAYDDFKRWWPECNPVGLHQDSRHSPCLVAMKDVIEDEGERWRLISNCDINRDWSAMMGQFRGELRAWFCEVAGAQSILHQDDPEYPDTGLDPLIRSTAGRWWWDFPMTVFAHQVRKHCHDCSVPLRGHGENARSPDRYPYKEQVSKTHQKVFIPKRKDRLVELVTDRAALGKPLGNVVRYLQNADK